MDVNRVMTAFNDFLIAMELPTIEKTFEQIQPLLMQIPENKRGEYMDVINKHMAETMRNTFKASMETFKNTAVSPDVANKFVEGLIPKE